MPATRTHPRASTSTAAPDAPSGSSSKRFDGKQVNPNRKKRAAMVKEGAATDASSAAVVPGVQKLKAALRQTRRLLAKDKLAADVRVAAERKLKAQEAELERAGMARKERTMATRYHKVKFFERQKVTRRIKQVKKQLNSPEVGKSDHKKLTKALHALRVDLNYINHYPKTVKYISLFPPEARSGEAPQPSSEPDVAETDARRAEIRAQIVARMESGELSAEPEMEVRRSELVKRSAAAGAITTRRETAKSEKPDVGGDEFFDVDNSEVEEEEEEYDEEGE